MKLKIEKVSNIPLKIKIIYIQSPRAPQDIPFKPLFRALILWRLADQDLLEAFCLSQNLCEEKSKKITVKQMLKKWSSLEITTRCYYYDKFERTRNEEVTKRSPLYIIQLDGCDPQSTKKSKNPFIDFAIVANRFYSQYYGYIFNDPRFFVCRYEIHIKVNKNLT